jgi:hypothetical protein
MKPLVYWCRWHDARLRLRGRDPGAIWGELAFPDRMERFHFDLQSAVLSIGSGDAVRRVRLDEMGVEEPL